MLSVSGSGVRAPVSVSGNSDPLATSEGDQGVTFSQSPHQGFQQLHSPTGHDPHAHAEHQSTKADLQDLFGSRIAIYARPSSFKQVHPHHLQSPLS